MRRRSGTFPVMGTTAHVVVLGGGPGVEACRRWLEELERRWSRFLPDSEVSRLNGAGGAAKEVSPQTAALVDRAVRAWRATSGRFDPTVLHAVRAAGYDRSFEDLPERPAATPTRPAPGCAGIEVDLAAGRVRLPAGVGFDPGGIAKGLAADLVASAALGHGATGVLVSVGGDLRVLGAPPPEGWEIRIDHQAAPPARVNLRRGALATSSTLRRRWATASGAAHHLVDPRTGRPSTTGAAAVSVLAGEAWRAEVLSIAVLVGWGDAAPAPSLVRPDSGAGVLATTHDGAQRTSGALAGAFSVGHVEEVAS